MTLTEYIASVSLLLFGAIIHHVFGFLQPRSRLVLWLPHAFLFERVNQNASIHTQTYMIQNLGRKSCEDIQIIHKRRPDHFQLQPELKHNEQYNSSTGEHIIVVDSLAPKEFFAVEILTYTQVPQLLVVRSKDGHAQQVRFYIQQAHPRWKAMLATFLIAFGFFTLLYWIIKGAAFLYAAASP